MGDLALAVDMGGTRTRVALVDRTGRVLARREEATATVRDPRVALRRLVAMLRGMQATAGGRVAGVGLALAGPTEGPYGTLRNPPNLKGWDGVAVGSYVHEALGVPVYADNDANLAAVGEHLFGVGQWARHLVYLTVSTGIGGGVLVDGVLLRGPRGLGAEVGHIPLAPDGPLCSCGRRGCLEALASGTAIARRAQELAVGEGGEGLLALVGGDVSRLRAEEVLEAATHHDALARRILDEATDYLAAGIVALVHIFTPQVVVLGGGVSTSLMAFYPRLLWRVRRGVHDHLREEVRIVPAALGDDVGLVGAAALAFRMVS